MRGRLVLAAAGGAITALAIPPVDLLPAVFVGLGILALVLRGGGVRSAFACGTVWATTGGLIGFRFVPTVVDRFTGLGMVAGIAALVLLAVVQGLAWGAGAAVADLLTRRARMPFAAAFGVGVYCACSLPSLFGWTPAGLLAGRPELVQLGPWIGERGVSALVASIAALAVGGCAALLDPGRRTPVERARAALPGIGLAGALLAGIAGYGIAAVHSVESRHELGHLRVALVDQDAPAAAHSDPRTRLPVTRRLRAISDRADAAGADVVVWPEGAYPVSLERPLIAAPRGALSPLSPRMRAPRLIGLASYEHRNEGHGSLHTETFNSATIVTPGGQMQPSYDKVHLLWFGETLPFAGRFHWLGSLLRSGLRQPGTRARPLLLDRPPGLAPGAPLRLGILTCYEDMLPGAGVQLAQEGHPQLLVNLTNNAWFAGTTAGALHARVAAMRAVELRTDLVRAVNQGRSMWIDAAGRVRRIGPDRPGFTMVTPSVLAAGAPLTFYGRYGDLPARVFLLALSLACWAARGRRRSTVRVPRFGRRLGTGVAVGSPPSV